MIRATFSADTTCINVALPKSWADLTQDELATVYDFMTRYENEDEDLRFHLLRYFLGIRFDRKRNRKAKDDTYRCTIDAVTDEGTRKFVLFVTGDMFAGWVDELNWLSDPGNVPVRLETIDGAKAVNALFHGVTFKSYYVVENYYQGYIRSKNPTAMRMIERLLYPGIEQTEEITPARVLNILNWIAQVKNVFAQTFTNFFRPASGEGEAPNMLDIMNNQIRILTGGDVTKEETINNIDCWRALTELDFKAKEAEELRQQLAKAKK